MTTKTSMLIRITSCLIINLHPKNCNKFYDTIWLFFLHRYSAMVLYTKVIARILFSSVNIVFILSIIILHDCIHTHCFRSLAVSPLLGKATCLSSLFLSWEKIFTLLLVKMFISFVFFCWSFSVTTLCCLWCRVWSNSTIW